MKNTKHIGDISEYAVILRCLELNIPVSKPIGDNQPYDIVIDYQGSLKKIQVKTLRLNKSTLKSKLAKNNLVSRRRKKVSYSSNEIDGFILYSPDTKRCYYLNVVVNPDISLSLMPVKDLVTQQLAKDFEFGPYSVLDYTKYTTICSKCSTTISLGRILTCKACSLKGKPSRNKNGLSRNKIIWPSIEEINYNLSNMSCLAYSKLLGVSDVAVKKHIARYEMVGHLGVEPRSTAL